MNEIARRLARLERITGTSAASAELDVDEVEALAAFAALREEIAARPLPDAWVGISPTEALRRFDEQRRRLSR